MGVCGLVLFCHCLRLMYPNLSTIFAVSQYYTPIKTHHSVRKSLKMSHMNNFLIQFQFESFNLLGWLVWPCIEDKHHFRIRHIDLHFLFQVTLASPPCFLEFNYAVKNCITQLFKKVHNINKPLFLVVIVRAATSRTTIPTLAVVVKQVFQKTKLKMISCASWSSPTASVV